MAAAAAVTMDFDAARKERSRLRKALTFKLGGEVFVVRKEVRPEVIAAADDLELTTSGRETLEFFDGTILAFVDPAGGAHDRYRKLREREKDPVTLSDIIEVLGWLVEAYTARPTQPSAPSSPGRRTTGTASTARSRSKAGQR